jgi:hypothetical protein
VGIVVLANPADGVVGFDARDDGKGGAGAAAPAGAGDRDAATGKSMVMSLA